MYKKKLRYCFTVIGLFLFSPLIIAQSIDFNIGEQSYDHISIGISFPTPVFEEEKTPRGFFTRVYMGNDALSSREEGVPALPVYSRLLDIPLCEEVTVRVVSATYEEFDLPALGVHFPVYPAQPSFSKSHEGEIPFVYSPEIYEHDFYYGDSLVRVEKSGILRNVNLATLYLSPLKYNPVQKKILVCRHAEIEISYKEVNLPATYQMKTLHQNDYFSDHQLSLLNVTIDYEKNEQIRAVPLKYLIVSHAMFRGALDEFIAWKRRKGFLVEVAYTDESKVGTTTTSIQQFIQSHYDQATKADPAPTYVLLVGDVEQLPSFNRSGHCTDLEYFTWTSGDYIPDCYYGRFSAKTVEQLRVQIAKTLMYEQYTMLDPSYLDKAILIAGTDKDFSPKYANGQVNYLSNNYFTTAQGYTTINKYLYNSSSQAGVIRSEIAEGAGFTNYTAHCSPTEWSDPKFSKSHIKEMNNRNKYGLMIGNCCQSNAFDEDECLGEALVRAENKGAFAYIGATDDTYWDEDYYWSVGLRANIIANPSYDGANLGMYDRLFHTHGEQYTSRYTSLGAMITAGNMAVQSSNTSLKRYYWEIYQLLGDPSVMPYLSRPEKIPIDVLPVLDVETSELKVSTVPHAYTALTYDGELVAATFADATGKATLSFSPLMEIGIYELAVSAQNYITGFQEINVVYPEKPLVWTSSAALTSESNPANAGTLSWNLKISNIGIGQVKDITVLLTTTSPEVTIHERKIQIDSLNEGENIFLEKVFLAHVSDSVKDKTPADFFITLYFNSDSSVRKQTLLLKAPELVRAGYTITQLSGNSDDVIDPGEVFKITLTDQNIGMNGAGWAYSALISHYSEVRIPDSLYNVQYIESNSSASSVFTLKIGEDVPKGTVVPLYYKVNSVYYEVMDTIYIVVGADKEGFESQNFSSFNWNNSSRYPWITTKTESYAGKYSAMSAPSMPNSSKSTLTIELDLEYDDKISYSRKVSSEEEFDYFRFYIDDELQEELSGNVAWSTVTFPLKAGKRLITFSYEKDALFYSGSDCAWIDEVVLPYQKNLAPEDAVIEFPKNVKDIPSSPPLKIYPNPARSQISVATTREITSLIVFDQSGRILKKREHLNGTVQTINIDDLARGIYFLRIISGDHVSVGKFIKQ